MSTVAKIKAAINQLSLQERDELEAWLHSDWDLPLPQDGTPPNVRKRLAEAARGHFSPGDRSNVAKILSALK